MAELVPPRHRFDRIGWSPRIAVAVVTGLFLAATATHFALRSEAAGQEPAARAEADPGPDRFSAEWWSSAQADCPAGTLLRGASPPEGREVWCERSDGTREGRHIGWHPNERRSFERQYRDGVLDGGFAEWFPSGQVAREGQHHAGVRTGRWVRWTAEGAIAEVVIYDDRGVATANR